MLTVLDRECEQYLRACLSLMVSGDSEQWTQEILYTFPVGNLDCYQTMPMVASKKRGGKERGRMRDRYRKLGGIH